MSSDAIITEDKRAPTNRNEKDGAAMKILEVFDKGGTDHSLKPLDLTELADLEELLHEKNGRLYFKCPIRKKDILAKPEEAVRQLWILRLTKRYGYPLTRLAVEYPITFGRDNSKRADIVVFDADRPDGSIHHRRGEARQATRTERNNCAPTPMPQARRWRSGATASWPKSGTARTRTTSYRFTTATGSADD